MAAEFVAILEVNKTLRSAIELIHDAFVLTHEFCGHAGSILFKVFFDAREFGSPSTSFNAQKLTHGFGSESGAFGVDGIRGGKIANGRADGVALALAAFKDPLQNAHVITKPRPHKFSGLVLAEPVNVENFWKLVGAF